MNPDLEIVLSADEEAVARVDAARRSSEERLTNARDEADRRRQDKARARQAELDRELASIAEDTARRVQQRQLRRRKFVSGLSEAAARLLPSAVDAWVRIVRDGPPGEGSPR